MMPEGLANIQLNAMVSRTLTELLVHSKATFGQLHLPKRGMYIYLYIYITMRVFHTDAPNNPHNKPFTWRDDDSQPRRPSAAPTSTSENSSSVGLKSDVDAQIELVIGLSVTFVSFGIFADKRKEETKT
jgi:hypothetical protein